MARLLIDTDVLIDHLRGFEPARKFLRAQEHAGNLLSCSVITHAELFAGSRPREERLLRALLATLEEVGVDEKIAEEAGAYCQKYTKSHGLLLPDALISASAKTIKASLVTLNKKHFPMEDITIVVPYEKR